MRDLDLVVSVAHRGGVDPQASASTVEVNSLLVEETCRLLTRVLPVTPAAVSVSNRVVPSSRFTSANSRARPTKLVTWAGRLLGST